MWKGDVLKRAVADWDAMWPKVKIEPQEAPDEGCEVEADLGPVIGTMEDMARDIANGEAKPGAMYYKIVDEEWKCATDGIIGEIGELDARVHFINDSKPTNPKDAIGSDKLPLHLVPSVLNIYASLAFLEGAVKYGKANWRVAGARMSIYIDAIERHLAKLKDGEWADEKTGVPHLSSMLACIGIILDAKLVGKLTDDRPPVAPTADLIAALEVHVPLLKALFKDHHPHQHTIMDAKEPA
jgi:hypothetical protein